MVSTVPMRALGRTGLKVSPIGLGLAALGRPGYINLGHGDDLGGRVDVSAMEHNAWGVLDAASEGGVRYFDAARSYGRAEAFLASWLERRGLRPGEVTVGSKWGYIYTAGWRVDADPPEVKDLSVETLRRQLAESRALLGPHLRLYQIHSATVESGVLEDRDVLDELSRLRAEGTAIGVSVTGPEQAETIRHAVAVGIFDAVQATWNLLERSAEAALAEAHAAGLGVIVKEVLANGRLTSRGDASLVLDLAAERGTTPDALAFAAVLARPWADVALSGATTVVQLRSNLTALDVDYEEELDRSLAPLVEEPARYWSTRAALPWN
jgi:aryl-alcohol dehydrogenase-like predicted oxidoreductase